VKTLGPQRMPEKPAVVSLASRFPIPSGSAGSVMMTVTDSSKRQKKSRAFSGAATR
jgi:hypothetical protein